MDNFVADTIFIDAPAERVFAALLEPEDILVWMDADEAQAASEEGGTFRAKRADGSVVSGAVARLEPPKRLDLADYHWEWGNARRGPMSVVFTLVEEDDGVWLNVRQDALDTHDGWQDFARSTRQEWVQATVALKRHIEQI